LEWIVGALEVVDEQSVIDGTTTQNLETDLVAVAVAVGMKKVESEEAVAEIL